MNEDENEKKAETERYDDDGESERPTNGTMNGERLGDVGQTSTFKQRKASVEGREGGLWWVGT
jgi:hypothetical protein